MLDVTFDPPFTASADESNCSIEDLNNSLSTTATTTIDTSTITNTSDGISTIRFTIDEPILLDRIQLSGRAVGVAGLPPLQIVSVRAKLKEEEDYHLLPGNGYQSAAVVNISSSSSSSSSTSSFSKFGSPSNNSSSSSSSATGGGGIISSRQPYRAYGLIKHIEIVIQGNIHQQPLKEDESLVKKMDLSHTGTSSISSSSSSSPSSSLHFPLDKTIHKTSSTGNRFTLPRLQVPKNNSDGVGVGGGGGGGSLNDTGGSSSIDLGGGVHGSGESVIIALFGFRIDFAPLGSLFISLVNMTNVILFAAQAQAQQEQVNRDSTPSLSPTDQPSASSSSSSSPSLPLDSPFTQDLVELYQLSGFAMMSSRSFSTACEMFRKAKDLLIRREVVGLVRTTESIRATRIRLAQFDLLIADCHSDHKSVLGKLHALQSGILYLKHAIGEKMTPNHPSAASSSYSFIPTPYSEFAQIRASESRKLSSDVDLQSGLRLLQPDVVNFLIYHLITSSILSSASNIYSSPLLHSTYKLLNFVLESGSMSGRQVGNILGIILDHVPITPSQAKSKSISSSPGDDDSSSHDTSDADTSPIFTDSSEDEDERRERERRRTERTVKRQTRLAQLHARRPHHLASFPINMTYIERTRRTAAASHVADTFFGVFRSVMEQLPKLQFEDSDETDDTKNDDSVTKDTGIPHHVGVECFGVICQHLMNYFPPEHIKHSSMTSFNVLDMNEGDADETVNDPLKKTKSDEKSAAHTESLLKDATKPWDHPISPSLLKSLTSSSIFAADSGRGRTSKHNTTSVNIAWTTFKLILLQAFVISAHSLESLILQPTPTNRRILAHASIFSSLFTALHDADSSEIREAASVAWCTLRRVYPMALAAVLTSHIETADDEKATSVRM